MNVVKSKTLTAKALVMIAILMFSGCSFIEPDGNLTIYLDGLPESTYNKLSENIRGDIFINVSVYDPILEVTSTVQLTDNNGYSASIKLAPGEYEVGSIYMSNTERAMFDVDTNVEKVTIKEDSGHSMMLFVKDVNAFTNSIEKNIATPEILNNDMYSRTVQYNGEVLNMETFPKTLTFMETGDGELAPHEQRYISSSSHPGISIIMQNNSTGFEDAWDCAYVGVHFAYNNVILPKGVKIGMNIDDIAHKETGLFKEASYFTGSPLIGTKLGDTNLVYYSEEVKDRITCQVLAGQSYISAITYEFVVYE